MTTATSCSLSSQPGLDPSVFGGNESFDEAALFQTSTQNGIEVLLRPCLT
jgi:hypothetical protein